MCKLALVYASSVYMTNPSTPKVVDRVENISLQSTPSGPATLVPEPGRPMSSTSTSQQGPAEPHLGEESPSASGGTSGTLRGDSLQRKRVRGGQKRVPQRRRT